MSILGDNMVCVRAETAKYEAVAAAYQTARDLYTQLSGGSEVALQGLGLELKLANGVAIPIPMPSDRTQLIELLEGALQFLGNEIGKHVDATHAYATAAKAHIDEARTQAAAALATVPLPAKIGS